jgi:hypothetical protein
MGELKYWAKLNLGKKVEKASAAIAGITTKTIFTVVGGRVCITALVGEVATTNIQAQANALTIGVDPTVGAAGALATGIEMNGALIGTTISITGNPADAAIKNTGVARGCSAPTVVPAGIITYATAADSTGEMKWVLWYYPIDDNAYVVAA